MTDLRTAVTERTRAREEVGLTRAEAAAALAHVGPNRLPEQPTVPTWRRVRAQLRDPLVMVLLAAAALTVVTGDFADATVIALVVAVNTTVGVRQELRAGAAVAALSAMTAPRARVVRDGVEVSVPADDLVPGDVVVLGEGDVVPADGSCLEAAGLLVDESALTGESLPVTRGPGGSLSAGTVVLRGRARAQLTATGAASALGRIAALLDTRVRPTPLQRRLTGLGRLLAAGAVVLCLGVLVQGLLRGEPTELMLVTAVSLAVAAVPESLPAVVSLSLALGAARMARRHAVVRRLPAVETLGSVGVLATDKTGTLTQGRMVLERVWTPAGTLTVPPTDPVPPDGAAALRQVLLTAVLCNDAHLAGPGDSAPPPGTGGVEALAVGALGDPTEVALLVGAARTGLVPADLVAARPRVGEVPFDSARRRMTTVHREPGGGLLVCAKGALDAFVAEGLLASTPASVLAAAVVAAEDLADAGYRVLAVAGRRLDGPVGSAGSGRPLPDQLSEDQLRDVESGLDLFGLVALADPPKESAARVVADCAAAGIAVVMITGDHPGTAAAIARRLGIVSGAPGASGEEAVVTGDQLRAGTVADLTRHRVFARTTPEQKLDIVAAWQASGAVVAMTGDGVNDGPALRRADIGVAMGGRGTEVARQAADLVLADDELGTVVHAVEEGRRVYANIRRFLGFALSGGAAEILVMLLGPALGLATPLLPAQILWVNLLTHGMTGVALGAEPVPPGAMHRPPRRPGQSILGAGLWQRVLWLATVITAVSLGAAVWARDAGHPWQTALFLSLTAAQLGVALGSRAQPFRRRHPAVLAAVAGAVVLAVAGIYLSPLRELLGTTALGVVDLLIALGAAAAGMAAAVAARRFSALRRAAAGPAVG